MTNMQLRQMLDDARQSLTVKDFRTCHARCIEALKINPRQSEPYYLLGILTADHKNFEKALDLFDRGLAVEPKNARLLAQKAKCLTALSRQQEASQMADQAQAANPTDALTLDTIGVVLSRVGRHKDAISFFDKAVALDPDNASFQYNLGSAQQFLGNFDEARSALEISLKQNPDDYKIYTSLVALSKQTKNSNFIPELEMLFGKTEGVDEQLQLGHALAKSYEDLGDYENSLRWLIKGKKGKRAALKYNFQEHENAFAAASKMKIGGILNEAKQSPTNPVFIVGMPRTGTTLVDRILSSHSEIVSAGELSNFGLFLKKASNTTSPYVLDGETLESASNLDLPSVGKQYLESTAHVRGNAAYFVDKMPLNFFYAPAILAALPQARIIVLRRSPMDTCLSNFRQLFRTSYSYYNYAYDLSDTAKFYARFDRLVSGWRETLPSQRFTEVRYEKVVDDLEGEARRLISFCGLEWQDACLNFHNNDAPVATASSVQVRAPIYSSSIGRWKKYGSALDVLSDTLKENNIDPI